MERERKMEREQCGNERITVFEILDQKFVNLFLNQKSLRACSKLLNDLQYVYALMQEQRVIKLKTFLNIFSHPLHFYQPYYIII